MAKNLYDFYTGQGKALPSISERAKTFESLGLGKAKDYQGTAEQNTSLLSRLGTGNASLGSGAQEGDIRTGANGREKLSVEGVWEPLDTGYASEVRDQLGGEDKGTDAYGLTKLSTELETAKQNREKAFAELKGAQTKLFNDEYAKRGLQEKKTKISEVDANITTERQKRDKAIADIRGNSGLSASQMAGDIKKAADYQNDVINNLIGERNAIATDYNASLEEVDRAVGAALKDKELEYKYWDGIYADTTKGIADYQKSLREQLADEQKQSNFERQLAQALEIAQMRSSDSSGTKLQLARDSYGRPLYWFNDQGDIIPLSGNEDVDGGGDNYDEINADVEGGDQEPPADTGSTWDKIKKFIGINRIFG